jgi:hypothetical protein
MRMHDHKDDEFSPTAQPKRHSGWTFGRALLGFCVILAAPIVLYLSVMLIAHFVFGFKG